MKAKKARRPQAWSPPKPTTPIAKLQDKISQLHSVASAADPTGPYPPKVRAPAAIEAAANTVSKHIDGVLSTTKKGINAAVKKSAAGGAAKKGKK